MSWVDSLSLQTKPGAKGEETFSGATVSRTGSPSWCPHSDPGESRAPNKLRTSLPPQQTHKQMAVPRCLFWPGWAGLGLESPAMSKSAKTAREREEREKQDAGGKAKHTGAPLASWLALTHSSALRQTVSPKRTPGPTDLGLSSGSRGPFSILREPWG